MRMRVFKERTAGCSGLLVIVYPCTLVCLEDFVGHSRGFLCPAQHGGLRGCRMPVVGDRANGHGCGDVPSLWGLDLCGDSFPGAYAPGY
jgi:hypothetical protein